MLTISFDRLGDLGDAHVLDVGAGFGRHCFEVARRGGRVVALDYADDEVIQTRATIGAMIESGEIAPDRFSGVVRGDATRLPFDDESFDVVVTSEVLEHIQDDVAALSEMVRVLKPGGRFAATVPSWFPEVVNWRLSSDYHAPAAVGGHVRIYSAAELSAKLRSAGLELDGRHRAHALHSPYWWLRCAVGPTNEDHRLVQRYRKLLEWEIIKQPRSAKIFETVFAPVLGKSIAFYATKPAGAHRATTPPIGIAS